MDYKIGDRVRVIANTTHFNKGEEFTIGAIDKSPGVTLYKTNADANVGLTKAALELITDESEYHIGDKVKIKECLADGRNYGNRMFVKPMVEYPVVTINHVSHDHYTVEENNYHYTKEMFEGLVESDEDEKFKEVEKQPMIFSDSECFKSDVEFVNTPSRRSCLEQAINIVCNDRENTYGKPEDNFALIAKYWENYLGFEGITPHDVSMMMLLLKVARVQTGKFKEDNYIDLAGYTACACEIGGRNEG